jgi:hypothetical protein
MIIIQISILFLLFIFLIVCFWITMFWLWYRKPIYGVLCDLVNRGEGLSLLSGALFEAPSQ